MLVRTDAPRYAELGMREQTFVRMLFYTLWDDGGDFQTYDDGLDHLSGYQYVCGEIRQIVGSGRVQACWQGAGCRPAEPSSAFARDVPV